MTCICVYVDVSQLPPLFSDSYSNYMMETIPSVHEQEDGIILGVVATGTSSRDSLLSWIRFLERTNPRLASDIPVLFTLTSPIGPTDALDIPAFPVSHLLDNCIFNDDMYHSQCPKLF